ncbi:MAG: bifunctional DNA-formamidopyrimidine glycosylase/DNA-(apurinic or apyrimidinic site) lyase [Chloroflexota bacterium]|nr:bifunctional DNA-formamidopyrimidine glycosylase/DNA-(apurinic or apyrimidinic site) lyase [Chloroflexota bacterium]
MPELPEIEVFRRLLSQGRGDSPAILRKKVRDAELLWEGALAAPSPDEFLARAQGQTVEKIGRRGKHLLIHLSEDTLVFHFRMSGEVVVEAQTEPIAKHCRLTLNFDDGIRLAFNNPRKFGRVWLVADPEAFLAHLGPEPLADAFTSQWLYTTLQGCHRQMKYFLLDQEVIAGLGNIYVDESLYLSKIHPRTKSDALSFEQAELLWKNIRQVLRAGIENQGTSFDWMYKGGDYQRYLKVYKRTGEPCAICGTPIKRIMVAQRGTHFCPSCQPAPEK